MPTFRHLFAGHILAATLGGAAPLHAQRTTSIGPITATVNQRETVPIPPVAGAIALVAGIGLLIAGGRRRT